MIYQLTGCIQHYDWGGKDFLVRKLLTQNPENLPFAEYWLGVHPGGSTKVHLGSGGTSTLASLIASDKQRYLGQATCNRFKALPFLLKVLDVKNMLSIQVHPSISKAKAGYAFENEQQIPLNAPTRSFRDENHKPEVMVALSEFWLLHGFISNFEQHISNYPFLNLIKPFYERGGIKEVFKELISNSSGPVTESLLSHLHSRIPLYHEGKLDKHSPDFWAVRAYLTFCKDGKVDPGLYCIYLMNIVHLNPGEAIYQPSGILHAYLEGQNIELMSNSDNVLRAGLTTKYINAEALIENSRFVETIPSVIDKKLNNTDEWLRFPVEDFALGVFNLPSNGHKAMHNDQPAIALILSGKATWSGEVSFVTNGLAAVFIPPQTEWKIEVDQPTQLFVASVPSLT